MRVVWGAASASLLVAGVLVAAGCGSGDTTTIIKEAPAETVERTTTVEVPADPPEPVAKKASKPKPAPEPEPELSEPPNTVGLPLDIAEEELEAAGYRPAPENTDTAFGIVVPSNYTVCTQDPPRGKVVVMLAQKYGC